jgi:hypothetical protein
MGDVQHVPIRADGQRKRPARYWHLGLRREPAAVSIQVEGRDLVVVLQANVQRVWHGSHLLGILSQALAAALYNNPRRAS